MIRWALKHALYATAVGFGGLVAWAANRPAIEGSGAPTVEDRSVVGEPTELVVNGTGDVVLVQGPEPMVRVTADDNIVPHLKAETSGRRLTLTTDTSATLKPKTAIRYQVVLPRLTAVTVSGAANVAADGFRCEKLAVKLSGAGRVDVRELRCQSLVLTLSGAGKANVAGAAEQATVKISGAGVLDATELKAATAEVQISGAGKASVWATNTLKARVSGAGTVKYKGAPQLEQKVNGAGTIRPVE